MFTGVYTALATPMSNDGAIDYKALEQLLTAQLKAGVQGIVLLGTTAETPTLSSQEKQEILKFSTNLLAGKVKIIIGTGANATAAAVENTKVAQAFNPDGVLVVTPYYNKPNPSGLIAHYQQVAALGTPVVLYHIPGRTGLKVPAVVFENLLAQVPQIVAVKESDYDMAHVTEMAVKYQKRINYLCGNDDLFPMYLAVGASGIISAAANVFAPAFVKIYQLFQAGQIKESFCLFAQIYPLIKACYAETNPTCIKYMLSKLGFGTATVRLPLGAISAEHQAYIDALLAKVDKNLIIQG